MNDEIDENRQSKLPHGAGIWLGVLAGLVFWAFVGLGLWIAFAF